VLICVTSWLRLWSSSLTVVKLLVDDWSFFRGLQLLVSSSGALRFRRTSSRWAVPRSVVWSGRVLDHASRYCLVAESSCSRLETRWPSFAAFGLCRLAAGWEAPRTVQHRAARSSLGSPEKDDDEVAVREAVLLDLHAGLPDLGHLLLGSSIVARSIADSPARAILMMLSAALRAPLEYEPVCPETGGSPASR